MPITKIDKGLPVTDQLEDLNYQTLELDGKSAQAKFDRYELDALYSGSGMQRKYIRNFNLSSATGSGAWYNWTHIKSESGYSIWKFDSDIDHNYNAYNEMYFDNKLMTNRGDASAEDITTFDNVFTYDGSYTDNSVEAGTEAGTTFNLLSATTDYIYIGSSTQFSGIRFKFGTRGRNNTLKVEYSNGSSTWTTMSSLNNDLTDNTSAFKRDGSITFTAPSNWNKDTVNGANVYWIRISTTTTPTTTAKAYAILPYNSVATLLALSSSQVTNEEWAFCSYDIPGTGSRLYGTFRNIGSSDYEGDFYITSGSTVVNKENFFRSNHAINLNYENSNYNFTGSSIRIPHDLKAEGAVDFGDASLEIPNGTSETTNVTGQIFLDTDGDGGTNFNGEVIQVYTGSENKFLFLMALPLAASEDNYVPTYDASGKTIQWEAISASTANTALSNLSSVAINTSLISDTDSTDDLGSSSKYWANAYIDKVTTPAISFPASQVTDADANTLDDYEEGTFSPSIVLSTPGNSATTVIDARYTKVGNVCHISLALSFVKGTGTGTASMSGLPFTSKNTGGFYQALVLSVDALGNANEIPEILINANATTCILIMQPESTGAAASMSDTDLAATAYLRVSGSYIVE